MNKQIQLLFPLLLVLLFFPGCDNRRTLIIFHAGSLTRPFEHLRRIFMEEHPEIQVVCEGAGSRACCRKITDLARYADIVASADYLVFEDLLMPEYADWYLKFATSRMVLAFDSHSKHGMEITSDNWHEILAREGVEFGHSDPDLDPAGYRALLCWKLADIHYGRTGENSIFARLNARCPPENIRPGSMGLIALLQNFGLDYAFEYEAAAKQHHLQFVQLPPEVDLGSKELADFYAQVGLEISGKRSGTKTMVRATPVQYAVTIPKDARNISAAEAFLELLMSERGIKVMEDNFQPVIYPAVPNDLSLIPEKLKKYCEQ
ncbi:MAG: substrate-binding domain-containing protein [Candidatus Wallbacteria bacterium]|nr:substrate-binding domain-containing protein [Candidatus Wallbacteria bacterium]